MTRNLSIILFAILCSVLSLSFTGKNQKISLASLKNPAIVLSSQVPAPVPAPAPAPLSRVTSVFDSLQLGTKGLSQEAFDQASKGFSILEQQGKLHNTSILTIADFSLPSNKKRLFIIDLDNYKVLYHTFVSHGRNTGREMATRFSNNSESYQSSPGFYVTRETYQGKNGYSLRLQGMERDINDKALDRGIVVHGAPYVSQAIANAQGYVGRSQGCPAVPQELARPIINTIRNGSCLFIYHPSYVKKSPLLKASM